MKKLNANRYPQLTSIFASVSEIIEAKMKKGKKAKAGAKKAKGKKAKAGAKKANAEAERKLAAKKRSKSAMEYPKMKKAKQVRSDFESEENYDPHQIASEWHGGQFTELYKFSSSGMVDSKFSAIGEVQDAMKAVENNPAAFDADEMEQLEFLKNYFEENLPEDPEDLNELPPDKVYYGSDKPKKPIAYLPCGHSASDDCQCQFS